MSYVVDGDTVVINGLGRVRLIGVNTPEMKCRKRGRQRFGPQARDFTRRLIDGRHVHVEYAGRRICPYGRRRAHLYLGDGTHVNAEIIRQGYGCAVTRFGVKCPMELKRAEAEARRYRRDIWAWKPRHQRSRPRQMPRWKSA